MTNDELRRLAEAAGGETWTPSLSGRMVNTTNAKIGGETPVCEIRGWGYLTGQGHGALGLSEAEAIALQRALAAYIAAANPARILALLDEVEALKLERDAAQTLSRKGSIMEEHCLPYDMAAHVRNAIERNKKGPTHD
jgi:hypothetical protein